jgi:hypothetical protein
MTQLPRRDRAHCQRTDHRRCRKHPGPVRRRRTFSGTPRPGPPAGRLPSGTDPYLPVRLRAWPNFTKRRACRPTPCASSPCGPACRPVRWTSRHALASRIATFSRCISAAHFAGLLDTSLQPRSHRLAAASRPRSRSPWPTAPPATTPQSFPESSESSAMRSERARHNKIIFSGTVGAGKSTAINALSDIPPVSTEAVASDDTARLKQHHHRRHGLRRPQPARRREGHALRHPGPGALQLHVGHPV